MLSCLTVSFSCGIVYSRGNRTPESEKNQTSVYLIKRKMKKKICIRTEGSSTTNSSSSSSSREAVQNVNWSTRRPPVFLHFSNYSSTPTYVVVVLFVVKEKSKLQTYSAEVPVLDVLTPWSGSRQESLEKMERRISGVSYMCWMDFHNATLCCGFYVPD